MFCISIVLSASVGCIKVNTDQYVSDLETVQGIDAKYGKTIHRGITSGGGRDGITPGCRERWELLAEDEMQVDQDVKRKRKGKSATAMMILADFSDDMLRAAQQHDRNKSDTV